MPLESTIGPRFNADKPLEDMCPHRAEIAHQTAEFLASGGRIQSIPRGESGLEKKTPKRTRKEQTEWLKKKAGNR